ncbi:hypothetical protein [Kitasatospora aureofaciens]|uniref:hypothetical protein n=1 Tax=Kitasatospora aureofaciens TaxID=1894 RepID=UPI0037C64DD3
MTEGAEPPRPLEASGLQHALADALGLATSWDASEDDTLRRLAACDPRRPDRAPDTARASCGA